MIYIVEWKVKLLQASGREIYESQDKAELFMAEVKAASELLGVKLEYLKVTEYSVKQ